MNMRKYLSGSTAFVITLVLGWSVIVGYRYLVSYLGTGRNGSAVEGIGKSLSVSDIDNRKDIGFAREYCLFDENQIFDDFDHLAIETNDDIGMPNQPRGALYTKREYKLKALSFGPDLLRFETETVCGTRYDFIGELDYVDEMEGGENIYPINGKFTKWENDKVTATRIVRLLPVVPNGSD